MPASKAAYIVILGVILQFVVGFLLVKAIPASAGFGGLALVIIGGVMMFFSLLGLIVALLFWFRRTVKAAAVLSVIFGIIGIVTQAGIIAGVFFLAAGILYLWKRI